MVGLRNVCFPFLPRVNNYNLAIIQFLEESKKEQLVYKLSFL